MRQTVVIDVVGLSSRLLKSEKLFISQWIQKQGLSRIKPVLPAVTCSVQSTYLTGEWPSEHGIVANGWYFKNECEVKLWRQSNKLVQAEKIWETAKKRDSSFTCANMFWWYNMYSSVDYSVTPRPQYAANGNKYPDCYSQPSGLRDELQEKLGTFPLFDFWGPKTSVKSSQWIADATMYVQEKYDPTLTLVYLPHLDYVLQKIGPNETIDSNDLKEIDKVLQQLITFYEARGSNVIVLSEYGITEVNNPIHINRILRKFGFIKIRKEKGRELLDAGASQAFAMADHQIAHVYVNDTSKLEKIKYILSDVAGVQLVLDKEQQTEYNICHDRSGDLVVVSDAQSWFTYYYWNDDRKAPDFARTVDIHKKPGYDPVEMFLDPKKNLLYPRLIGKLLMKKIGFRNLMNFIPLDATLVKGSHGSPFIGTDDYPVFVSSHNDEKVIEPTKVKDLILQTVFENELELIE